MKARTCMAPLMILLSLAVLTMPGSAKADIAAQATVRYGNLSYVYTTGEGRCPTVNFSVWVTAAELGLSNSQTHGFCVDASEGIGNSTYDFTLKSLFDFDGDAHYKAAWLMDQYTPTTATAEVAAVQALIWKTVHGDSFTPTYFTASGAYTDYNTYAAALDDLVLTDAIKADLSSKYMVLINDGVQDLMVYLPNDIVNAPIPGSATLLGIGLLTTAARRYRRRTQGKAGL